MARRSSRSGARTIGYAVIGAGHIAQVAVLPAFENAPNSRLVAIISGDRDKREELGKRYGVPTCDYDGLDACLEREDVDAAYIALPNDQHAEITERCARAGVHVLCEKPMALTEAECLRMIRACEEHTLKLMIAYRLHFDPANLRAIERVREGDLGEPRLFSSAFSFQVREGNIRTRSRHGGGPLWDVGIYCVNAARYLFRSEPIEVFAFATTPRGDPRFVEVDATVGAVLRFAEPQVATFSLSFDAANSSSYRVVGTQGELVLENAYAYRGDRTLRFTAEGKTKKERFGDEDQFGPELTYFSDCILSDTRVEPDGYEGLADVRILAALHRSILSGQPVHLPRIEREQRPDAALERSRPPLAEPAPVHAEPPSQR